jgi:hypothetical protein
MNLSGFRGNLYFCCFYLDTSVRKGIIFYALGEIDCVQNLDFIPATPKQSPRFKQYRSFRERLSRTIFLCSWKCPAPDATRHGFRMKGCRKVRSAPEFLKSAENRGRIMRLFPYGLTQGAGVTRKEKEPLLARIVLSLIG